MEQETACNDWHARPEVTKLDSVADKELDLIEFSGILTYMYRKVTASSDWIEANDPSTGRVYLFLSPADKGVDLGARASS